MLGNIYVFGDIYGNYMALRAILDQLRLKPSDKLIFLGNIVDKKSQSREVLECLINLDKTYNCVFVRGNHDKWAYDYFLKTNGSLVGNHEHWFTSGGSATYNSLKNCNNSDFNKYKKFFDNMVDYYIHKETDSLFVHGGFDIHMGFKSTAIRTPDMLWWDRELWNYAVANHYKDSSIRYGIFDNVYIGHTSLTNFPYLFNEKAAEQHAKSLSNKKYIKEKFGSKFDWEMKYINDIRPVQCCNVINMDTGAGSYGKLSCLNIANSELYLSKIAANYYKLKEEV